MLIDQGTTPTIVFLLVDATDDETAETGLSPTVQISKAGGSFANTTNSATEIANGWYKVALTATETNTEGALVIRATGTGADEWRDVYQVVDFDTLKADVSGVATAANLATVDTVVDSILEDTGTTLPGTLSTLGGYIDTEVAAILAAVDTEVAAIKAKTDNLPADPADDSDIDSQLAAIAAYIDTEVAAILAAVDTEVAAIKAKTDNLPTDPADQSAVEAAITSATSGLATAAALATVDTVVDTILVDTAELQTNQGNWLTATGFSTHSATDVWAVVARTLTANTNLNDPTAAAIADAVLDELVAGHTTAGSLSKAVIDILADTGELQTNQGNWLTADVSGLATAANLATVDGIVDSILEDTGTTLPAALTTIDDFLDTEVAAILADTNELQTDWANGGRLDLILDAASAPSAADVADAVWDEALSGHSGAGTAGLALSTASSGGVDPSVLADAVWDEALSGHVDAGTAGKKLTDLVNPDLSGLATAAALATVDGIVDDILIDTGTTLDALIKDVPTNSELATALAGADDATLAAIGALNNVSAAQVNAEVDSALADYDGPTKAELDSAVAPLATAAAVTALNDLSAADVNAEVDTALSDYDAPTKAELDAAVSLLATADAVADLPTNTELATALAGADDATLAAISALNDITVADIWAGLGDTEKNAIADAILSRSVFHVEDTAGVHSLTELILAAFESSIAGTDWTINQTDHVTLFNVRSVTVDANADPITGVEGGN